MDLPDCFNGKNHQKNYLKEISRVETNSTRGEERVVYWCKECGACVVDIEYDKRFHHSEISMQFPKSLEQSIKS
jgi:hypothetical protein